MMKSHLRLVMTLLAVLALFSSLPMQTAQAQSQREVAELTMRVDRLEAQIRELTGQIDRLTYALENQGSQPASVTPPLGAAPQPSLPSAGSNVSSAPNFHGSFASQPDGFRLEGGGPLDLSALIANGAGAFDQAGRQPVASDQIATSTGFGGNTAAASGLAAGTSTPVGASGPRQAYDLAYGHVLRGDYDSAETQLAQFMQQYPSDPLVPDAMFWLGEVQFVRGNYRDAATQFLETYSTYPKGAKAPDSLLKLGLSLKELGEREAACATYAELVRKYPTASPPVKDRVRQERRAADCI